MSSLFKNNYKVYLYKFNYSAIQSTIQALLAKSANEFLFESFVTDLYTVGVPSDIVSSEITNKYQEYIKEYYEKKSTLNTKDTKVNKQIGESKTITYTSLGKEDKDTLLKYNRATISGEDNIIQKALAQNYALQMLQRDYEDGMMKKSEGNDIKINWLNTMEKKQQYDEYVKKSLNLSTKLLNKIFNPIIDDIKKIQNGELKESKYVYVIELTNLSKFSEINTIITERTKYTNNNFIALNTDLGDVSNDSKEDAVDSIGVITTTLEGLSNMTNFNLRQDILLKHNINIEANDIIEIVNVNQNKVLAQEVIPETEQEVTNDINRNTQFIGFVTKVSLSQRFSGVSLLNVTCEGISKILSLNPTISNNAVAPQFSSVTDFIAGTDKTQATSNASTVNVFSSFFDGLNAFDLFTKLLSDVLAVSPVEEDKTSYNLRLISDPKKLKNLPYQYAKPLIVLYHLAVSISTIREVGHKTHIVLAQVENNVNQEKLQAYLLMIRSHFDLFWSTMTTPISILQTLANNTFLEIFEDRNGILILRPPRYNTWIEDDIIEEKNFIEWTQSIDDSTLKSRSDYQWSIPAIGVQNEFCGGYYQDIPALLKYGFRIDSPKNSPSVQSEIDAAVYSALDVTKSNSNTRTFELTVPLTQDYILGRVYYFPINKSLVGNVKSTGFVGYLTAIATTISPGNVDIHRLTFKYMRNAELLDNSNNIQLSNKAGAYILNFKRLPELSLYQSSVTPDMITESQRKRLDTKANNLCANNRYYWASFEAPNKIKFDNYITGNNYVSRNEMYSLYTTMAPTNIKVKDFKSYEDVLSSAFTPKQQLINAIWFTDLLMRTNCSPEHVLNSTAYYSREIRTKKNQDKFLAYLNNDATFKGKYNSVDYVSDINVSNLSAPYATINSKFFITDSLIPNMLSGFVSDDLKDFEITMNEILQTYNKYLKSDSNRKYQYKEWYVDKYSLSDFNDHLDRLDKMVDAYNKFSNNRFAYYEFEMYYDIAGKDVSTLLKYANEKEDNTILNKLKKYFPIEVLKFNAFSKLYNLIKDIYHDETINVGIPAYKFTDSNNFPLVQSLFNRGAYIAGVSPIDYNSELLKFSTEVITSKIHTDEVKLKDMSLKNAKGVVIGKFTKLILDVPLYTKTKLLYYYPVIEFDNEAINNTYGIDVTRLKSSYITTEAEINQFIHTGKIKDKFLPCVIRIGCTEIPESKIPTIQQIYNHDGLYVGVDKYTDGRVSTVNDYKAIFDPSVLYTWNNNDFENLYNVTIYNLIEFINGNQFGSYLFCNERLNTDLNLQTNGSQSWGKILRTEGLFSKVPCVYNTTLNINLDKNIVIGVDTQKQIVDRFKECVVKVSYKIDDFENGYLYIQDRTYVNDKGIVNEVDKNSSALVCRLDGGAITVDNAGGIQVVSNTKESSYTTNFIINSERSEFTKSVELKEQIQVNLYDSNLSYMKLNSRDWYAYKIQKTQLPDSNISPYEAILKDYRNSQRPLKIIVHRYLLDASRTIGKLYINTVTSKPYCYTLEDTYRGQNLSNIKVDGKTAIPNGIYRMRVTPSPAFEGQMLPELLEVPYFTGIRIHTGSGVTNTKGCILVGDFSEDVYGNWSANSTYVNELGKLIKDAGCPIIDISII